MDEMPERGERKSAKGKGRAPWVVWAVALACALGLAAVALRFEVTELESSALVLDRWTGGMMFVHGNGSVTRTEQRKRAGNIAPPAGSRGGPVTAVSPALRGGKAAAPKGPAGGPGAAVATKGSVPLVWCIRIPFLKKNPAPSAQPPPFKKKNLEGTGAQVAPSMKWRWGKLHYRVAVEPFTEALKRLRQGHNPTFLIDLVDRNGFTVRSIRVSLPEMGLMRDEKDRIAGLELAGSVPLGQEEYLSIRDWRIRKDD